MDSKSLKSSTSNSASTSANSPMPMPNLASRRPSSGIPLKPASDNASTSESRSESDGEEEVFNSQYMIYYLLGELCLRPMGIITGEISTTYETIVPYPLRRSGGEVKVVTYEPMNMMMMHDYNYVMETNIAPRNTSNITIVVSNQAKLNIYGEMFAGYGFDAPTLVEMKGMLNMAYWTTDGLAEEPLNCNSYIEVAEGVASLFVCDNKQIVILYDADSKYVINLEQEEGEQTVENGGEATGKSGQAAKTLNRISSSAQPGKPSENNSTSGSGSSSASAPVKTVTGQNNSSDDSVNSSDSDKPIIGVSKIKVKRKGKGGKSKASKLKTDEMNEPKQSKSLAQKVIDSIVKFRKSKPVILRDGPKSHPTETKISESNSLKDSIDNSKAKSKPQKKAPKCKLRSKSKIKKATLKQRPNVKLTKSKFVVPSATQSSLNNLSQSKTSTDSDREASGRQGRPLAKIKRSKAQDVPKSKIKVNRPSSVASIKSNASLVATKSQMFKIKAKMELSQLLRDLNSAKSNESLRNCSDENARVTHDAMVNVKEKIAKLEEVMLTVIENASEDDKKQLTADLDELMECTDKLTADKFEGTTEKMTSIVKKIEMQLDNA